MSVQHSSKMNRVTYRKSTVADLDVLVEHRHRMWSEIGNRTEAEIRAHDARYRKWARALLRSGELVGFIADAPDGSAVGSGLVWFRPDQPRPGVSGLITPYILSMYTEPKWRGQRIATRIVRRLVATCRKEGCPSAVLHASKYGRRAYGRLGFERTWEMRYWIDRRIPRRRALAEAKVTRRKKKGLDRGR